VVLNTEVLLVCKQDQQSFGGGNALDQVSVTSVDAHFAEQQLASYASSKAAATGAVRAIALDYAHAGMQFKLLAPGPIRGRTVLNGIWPRPQRPGNITWPPDRPGSPRTHHRSGRSYPLGTVPTL